ncbi:MAG: DUF1343 domain-containing protein [Lentisphaerae bacterium]|nr:DUF1343 domain-containing protein [Lentisphaerota bacterium]
MRNGAKPTGRSQAKDSPAFRTGLDTLLSDCGEWLAGRRIGLVSHPAAINRDGRNSVDVLAGTAGLRLKALFGLEHGFFGEAAAGLRVARRTHPRLRLPVFSLYGANRSPSPAMLRGLDTLVFDIQDIGVRSYTFISSLRLIMETAARAGLRLVVADRPVPAADTVDGPMLDPSFASFVAAVPSPMVYGMTPGESALWLRETLGLDLDLRVAPMRGYSRDERPHIQWPAWVPPSPQIRSWDTALSYPALVFTEALPFCDHARNTPHAFQVVAVPGLAAAGLLRALERSDVTGAHFVPHTYVAAHGAMTGRLLDGVRLVIHSPSAFRPCECSLALLAALRRLLPGMWRKRGVRRDFMDKLYGTDRVRNRIESGDSPADIAAEWRNGLDSFRKTRLRHLLYR